MAEAGAEAAFLGGVESALDRLAFAARCGLPTPDPWQREFLSTDSRRVIATCARQTGKSEVASITALHRALYYPGSSIVLVSPSLRQSQLLFKRVTDHYVRLGKPVAATVENRLSLELENGSTIASLPGSEKTIRGYSAVDLLLLDEAAGVDDSMYAALTPMTLVSGGRIVLVSTPRGRQGRFYEIWRARIDRGWAWFHIPVTAVERIPPEAVDEYRRDLTDLEFRQELLVEFTAISGAYFDFEAAARTVTDEVEPLVISGIEETYA